MHCCKRKKSASNGSVSGNGNGHKRRCGGRKPTLLFGLLIGVAIGLMFAPKPGSETVNGLRETLLRRLPV